MRRDRPRRRPPRAPAHRRPRAAVARRRGRTSRPLRRARARRGPPTPPAERARVRVPHPARAACRGPRRALRRCERGRVSAWAGVVGVSVRIERVALSDARALVERFHGYGACGNTGTYVHGAVRHGGGVIAAWIWLPPAPGAARAVSPGDHRGALALSRMVAIPREERPDLPKLSKALRAIAAHHIDRARWPVLVTYSDASQGHSGHVYRCAGWQPEGTRRAPFFVDADGRRVGTYVDGRHRSADGMVRGWAMLTRWTRRACPIGEERAWLSRHFDDVDTGRRWKSGKPARALVRKASSREQTSLW